MVKRSLPRRPSSFSSRRAAALPGEIETTEIPPFPVGFCRSTEELLGGSDARSLLAALDTPSPVSVRFNPYKVQGPSGQRISGNDPSVNPTGESVVVTGEKPIDSAAFSQGTDSGGTPLIRPAQLAGNEVPWCRYGYYLPQRPSFTPRSGVSCGSLLCAGGRVDVCRAYLPAIVRTGYPVAHTRSLCRSGR